MPKWIWPVVGVIIMSLGGTTSGLLVFIFLRMDGRVEKMSDEFYSLRQKVAEIDAKLDTYSKTRK